MPSPLLNSRGAPMDPVKLRPGDVLRPRALGPVTAKPGHTLVVLFLGACHEDQEPVVPEYLRSIGFTRSHVFEVTLYWSDDGDGLQDYSSVLLMTADTPLEAVQGAVRYARGAERSAEEDAPSRDGHLPILRGLTVALMRLGPIGPDGRPHDGRGRTFASWSAASGEPLEKLLEAPPPA